MSRTDPQMKIRLTEELKDKISDTSKASGRSMNAEIVHRLEESFNDTSINYDEMSNNIAQAVAEKILLDIKGGKLTKK